MILTSYLRYYILITGFLLICFTSNALDTHVYQPGADKVQYIGSTTNPTNRAVSPSHIATYRTSRRPYRIGTTYMPTYGINPTYHTSTIRTTNKQVHSYGATSHSGDGYSYSNGATATYNSPNGYSSVNISSISLTTNPYSANPYSKTTNTDNPDFSATTIGKRRVSDMEDSPLFDIFVNEYLAERGITNFIRGTTDIDYDDFLEWFTEKHGNSPDHANIFDKIWEYIRKDDQTAPLDDGLLVMLFFALLWGTYTCLYKKSSKKIVSFSL